MRPRFVVFCLGALLVWLLPAIAAEPPEPIGPSSRRTGLVFSEIMYHPSPRVDGRQLEYVEIYNSQTYPEELSGYKLDGPISYTFPNGIFLASGSYLVIARNTNDFKSVYIGVTNLLGNYSGSLGNKSDVVRLRHRTGSVFLEAVYDTQPPWPAEADGAGHSLVLTRPSYGERSVRAWGKSDARGGTPGRPEVWSTDVAKALVISEFLAHTDDPLLDFVELHNAGNSAVDISGFVITDDLGTNRFIIPEGTLISARGYLSFNQTQLKFALSSAGETIYLIQKGANRVLDAVRFSGQANGISSGRSPISSPSISPLQSLTPGLPNSGPRLGNVVISEIFYHPPTEDDNDEFLELYNRGVQEVDLSGWKFADGIQFQFPHGTKLAPGAYIIISRNQVQIKANYPTLAPAKVFGDYQGTLSNQGERIALARPDPVTVTNETGQLVNNLIWIVESEVTYGEGGHWGKWADGGGSSLELIDVNSDIKFSTNWKDSDETKKSSYGSFAHTGRMDLGTGPMDALQIVMLDDGEALVDNVEVLDAAGGARILNGNFEAAMAGWFVEGSHGLSGLSAFGQGDNSSFAMHIRASTRGDTGSNRIRTQIAQAMTANETGTLRARVRWLKGAKELLLRLRGSYLELPVVMNIPKNLGTPGGANSRAIVNAGPSMIEFTHRPVLPQANETVRIIAQIQDPQGVQSAAVYYRVDAASPVGKPSTPLGQNPGGIAGEIGASNPLKYNRLAMVDDGTGGDEATGDGIYTATLPVQATGTLVAYTLSANDNGLGEAATQLPNGGLSENYIRYGESDPGGSLGTYRFWMTQDTLSNWGARSKMDNHPLPLTFVYNKSRVIHNAGGVYAGSPHISPGYTTPNGVYCGYVIDFDKDDTLLGSKSLVLDWSSRDTTAQQEMLSYWIANYMGVPYAYRRHIHLHVNGVTEIQRNPNHIVPYEDTQQPGGDMVSQWFPENDNGDFYKIEQWFEFDSAAARTSLIAPTIEIFETFPPGLPNNRFKKTARYRWNWLKRAVNGSSHDYTNIFHLADALNLTNANYVRQTFNQVDVTEWMRTFAVERIVVNFDSYGYDIGKNMYAYKPPGGRWAMMMFDIDWVMLASGANGYRENSPLFSSQDPVIGRMYSTANPAFRREYMRAFFDAVQGPLKAANYNRFIDANYNALQTNGFPSIGDPRAVKSWLEARRTYLNSQLTLLVAPKFALNIPPSFTLTKSNLLVLSGTAPIGVAKFLVNDVPTEVTWTSETNFTIKVAVPQGTTPFVFRAVDNSGKQIDNARTFNLTYSGPTQPISANLVLNEIHHSAGRPGVDYIEIANLSTNLTYDLRGYRVKGLDLSFTDPTLILPGHYLIIAENAQTFGAAFGYHLDVAAEFNGELSGVGERLQLVRPLTTGGEELIDSVTYETNEPWPVTSVGQSLQLIDPRQENRRVANWRGAPATPGAINANAATVAPFPTLWINEIQPQNKNTIVDSAGNADPWIEIYNFGSNTISLTDLFLTDDYSVPLKFSFPPGGTIAPGGYLLIWLDGQVNQNTPNELHSSFRLAATQSRIALVGKLSGSPVVLDYIEYSTVGENRSLGSIPNGDPDERQILYNITPGASNSGAPPPIKINEWLAGNGTGSVNSSTGQRDDWIELYNAGTVPVDLGDYLLTDDLSNANKFRIPAGSIIPPRGFMLIWANESSMLAPPPGDVHASFKLSLLGESIALYTPGGGLIDQVIFAQQTTDVSQGRYVDGSTTIQFFKTPTPRSPNISDAGSGVGPRIQGITLMGGQVKIVFATVPDRTYQLQHSDSLIPAQWKNVGGSIKAAGSTLEISDSTTGIKERYYRILQVN